MVAFSIISALAILSSLLLASPSQASPVSPPVLSSLPSIAFKSWFCQLVHATLAYELCLKEGSTAISVNTPLGSAQGVVDVSGVNRFVVKYASAERWCSSSVATAWELPYVNDIVLHLFSITYTHPQQWLYECLCAATYVPSALCG
jgi:hypothetical protein